MRNKIRATTLVCLAIACLHPATVAPFELSWVDQPVADGTVIRVHGFYATPWPGQPENVAVGSNEPLAQRQAPNNVLWAVFGDTVDLPQCERIEIQSAVLQDGADGVFTARLDSFAPSDTVTVFFVWNQELDSVGYAVNGVDLGAGHDAGPPGAPGPPQIRFLD